MKEYKMNEQGTRIPIAIWEAFQDAFKDPAVKFIGWSPEDREPPVATLYVDEPDEQGNGILGVSSLNLPQTTAIKQWKIAHLLTDRTDMLLSMPAPPVGLDYPPLQPGDRVAGATVGAFLQLIKDKSIVFITAGHAESTADIINLAQMGKTANIIDRDDDLDILIAGFKEPVNMKPMMVRKAETNIEKIAPAWKKNQRFGLIGAGSEKVAYGKVMNDTVVMSEREMRAGRREADDVIVLTNRFEVVLDPKHALEDGDSGGPALFAAPKQNKCLNEIAGIVIQRSMYDGRPAVLVTKMTHIAERFEATLFVETTSELQRTTKKPAPKKKGKKKRTTKKQA